MGTYITKASAEDMRKGLDELRVVQETQGRHADADLTQDAVNLLDAAIEDGSDEAVLVEGELEYLADRDGYLGH
jgi:hypothetical protein